MRRGVVVGVECWLCVVCCVLRVVCCVLVVLVVRSICRLSGAIRRMVRGNKPLAVSDGGEVGEP